MILETKRLLLRPWTEEDGVTSPLGDIRTEHYSYLTEEQREAKKRQSHTKTVNTSA